MESDPYGYVAQEIINLSTVPTWCDNTLAARHVDLRPFTLLGRDGYVSCGGLTRVAGDGSGLLVSNQAGSLGKDTWVLGGPPAASDPAASAAHAAERPAPAVPRA